MTFPFDNDTSAIEKSWQGAAFTVNGNEIYLLLLL